MRKPGPKVNKAQLTWAGHMGKLLASVGARPEQCLDREEWREIARRQPRKGEAATVRAGTIQVEARRAGRRRSCVICAD